MVNCDDDCNQFLVALAMLCDAVALALAVLAERTNYGPRKVYKSKDDNRGNCQYEYAFFYGVGALILVMVGHILILSASRCFSGWKNIANAESKSYVYRLFLRSWVFLVVAEGFLIAGLVWNAIYWTKYETVTDASCETILKGVFATGAACIVVTFFATVKYHNYQAKEN